MKKNCTPMLLHNKGRRKSLKLNMNKRNLLKFHSNFKKSTKRTFLSGNKFSVHLLIKDSNSNKIYNPLNDFF